ncbi:MAG: TrbG/VirB9 family P-type conjugative transfer protein [Alphaproteobacteria bacterium]|nr:TrbG/VirB9 family P-type conjugative transfer protein [Alphaproteobacteria bacterium]
MLEKFISFITIICFCVGLASAEVPVATDSRIKTYVYNQNDVYLILISSGFQSSIEFEKGEVIKTLSMGDSYSWTLTPVGNRLFIKPMENNVRTNMTVITNLRTYQFDIASKSEDLDASDIAYVIRFYYPNKIKV